MDIQGYIIDHWLGKMSAEKPVLVIYDRNALYHSVLPLAEEKGVKVIDTTKGLLHVYGLWVQIGCNFEMYKNKKSHK